MPITQKANGRWLATFSSQATKNPKNLGTFATREAAERAYKRAEQEYAAEEQEEADYMHYMRTQWTVAKDLRGEGV